MQKFKYILVISVLCTVIGAGIIFGMLMNASADAEKKYQETITAIDNDDWESASKYVSDIPNYKEASLLYVYIYPHTLFYSKYKSNIEEINGYSQALKYIKEHKKEFTAAEHSKYILQINELEKTLNFKISEIKAKTENQDVMTGINESVNLIKSGNYTAAQHKLAFINTSELSSEKQQLQAYINLLNAINANNNKDILAAIKKLDPNYTGDLSNEIKNSVQAYADLNKWNSLYKPESGKNQVKNTSVAIGDQRSSVIQNLGEPVKQNTISNKYGTFEELIFNNNKLVYLENNVVTAVKG